MKEANFSPIFAFMYIGLCDIARENGYALAVHGTLNCDFDLVAIPWTDEAIEPFALVKQIEARIGICEPDIFLGLHSQYPELKPYGRLAWLIKLGNGAALDISVMPKIKCSE